MRRRASTIVVTIVSFTLAVAAAPPALAMGQTPVPSWMTNGKQYASVIGNGRIYFGGQFTQVRSAPLGSPGPKFSVSNLGAIDLASGEGVSGFGPAVTHATQTAFIRALALSPDGSRLYIGGRFDAVDGTKVRNVASIDTSDGSVDATFTPTVGSLKNQVFSLLLSPDGSTLYVGGKFSRVNGAARSNLTALDTSDGSLRDWAPAANDNVRAMDLAVDGASIFIVGAFSSIDNVTRESIARVDASTGVLHPWSVSPLAISGPPMTGWSVDAAATAVYAGFGRGPNWFGAYSATTGTQLWRRNTSGNVQKVLLSENGSELFVGGHFGTGRLNQTFSECGSALFRGLLVANPATGAVDCSWIPQLTPFGNNFNGVWDIDATPSHLWFVGNFSTVNGVAQANVARAAR